MIDWLLSSIDPTRVHDIGEAVSWHARTMVGVWSFLIPLGIMSARFFKILPNQDWPKQLDNRVWWLTHQILQYSGGVVMLFAVWLIWDVDYQRDSSIWHLWLGWITVGLCSTQYIAGWLRGTKGGPAEVERTGTLRGDHFDMTKRRKLFEYFHKTTGYLCLFIALAAIISGLWMVNAPRWMWIGLMLWWMVVIFAFVMLQKMGQARDTYEAIWGPDPDLPGNKLKSIGFWVHKR